LHNDDLKSLLNKAKEHEKRYDWLGAVAFYREASGLVSEDFLENVELQESIGVCFSNAALQAETIKEFTNRMTLALKTFERTVNLVENTKRVNEAKITHSKALVAYASSWLAKNIPERKNYSDDWWNLEKKTLKVYEKSGDQLAIGKTCNDLVRGSCLTRFFIATDWSDFENSVHDCISLGEKAITTLFKLENDYELARAYCWTSWYYGMAIYMGVGALEGKQEEFGKKALNYSKKAFDLSKKIGDANLIGWSSIGAAEIALMHEGNPTRSLEFNEITRKQSLISKDNYLKAVGFGWASFINPWRSSQEEDPDKQREIFNESIEKSQSCIHYYQLINLHQGINIGYRTNVESLSGLAAIETKIEKKRALLKKAIENARLFLEQAKGISYLMEWTPFQALSDALYGLAKTESKISEKQRLLEEALETREKQIKILQQKMPFYYYWLGRAQYFLALIQAELSRIKLSKQEKVNFLINAVSSMENCLKIIAKDSKEHSPGWKSGMYGGFYYLFGKILNQLYLQTKERNTIKRAIEVYDCSAKIFSEANSTTREAESYWQIAKLHDELGDFQKAAQNYESAAAKYKIAAEKIPHLKDFYDDYSNYMLAWGQIEKAKHYHSTEEYNQSRIHYEKAASLHETSQQWSYLAPNYLAWANMEKAEDLSRNEETQEAILTFQQALEQFTTTQESIKSKIKENMVTEEKEMAAKLVKASSLRHRYCQARIDIEQAKILDRNGEYNNSSKCYGSAAEILKKIIGEIEFETTRNEIKLVLVLCEAWKKMALAEEKTSPELYLEASQLFEQTKDYSLTKKTSLLALGNSSFCKALAAGTRFQTSLEFSFHSEAKGHLKNAENFYLQAGFKAASEYAKATQRLFDAYVFMNQAESEVDQDKRAKHYQMAEKLLQISEGSFMNAKQPEKAAQVQQMLKTVREDKDLAFSLNEVLHVPSIVSTTLSFRSPNPTGEVSVGLERFEHANVQANLIAGRKEVKVGESFCLSVEFVNAGKEPALLTSVEDFVPSDFVVVKKPEIYRMEDTCLNMKGKQLGPLKLVEVKLVLQPSKKGQYQLNPKVHYLDELGQNRSIQLKPIEIKVEEVVLADRVSTGTEELDSLLLGGIPEGYAVALTGSPSDERDYLIKNFLEEGTKEEITFYVTTEADGLENLLENANFCLFLCNPKPKVQVPDLPNIYKLRSKTDLTNLSISLAKAYRNIDQSSKKRVCVEIVSDVLLSYRAEATRRWISELITDLGSKGFTMLAVVDPLMHASEELYAVLGLFDGEISLTQTEDPLDCKKSIRVKKLRNQDYIKNPICLI